MSGTLKIIDNTVEPAKTLRIFGSRVHVGGSKSLDDKPNANIDGPVQVQTMAFENNNIAISGINLLGEDGSLQYEDVLRWYRHKYNGTNKLNLFVIYGQAPPPTTINIPDSATTDDTDTFTFVSETSVPTRALIGASAVLTTANTLANVDARITVTYSDSTTSVHNIELPVAEVGPPITYTNGVRVSISGFSTTKQATNVLLEVRATSTGTPVNATAESLSVQHAPASGGVPQLVGTKEGYDYETNGIPVVLENYDLNIDTKDTRNGYIPMLSLVFKETL